jgi:hypothetical protein
MGTHHRKAGKTLAAHTPGEASGSSQAEHQKRTVVKHKDDAAPDLGKAKNKAEERGKSTAAKGFCGSKNIQTSAKQDSELETT